MVQWLKPPIGVVKLNFDGACRGNPGLSAVGGIIQNANGDVLFAYSSFYSEATSFIAECHELLQGVQWLQDHGLFGSIIEVDSKVLFDYIMQKAKPLWRCWYYVQAISLIHHELQLQISHCYREANQVADSLANLGCD